MVKCLWCSWLTSSGSHAFSPDHHLNTVSRHLHTLPAPPHANRPFRHAHRPPA